MSALTEPDRKDPDIRIPATKRKPSVPDEEQPKKRARKEEAPKYRSWCFTINNWDASDRINATEVSADYIIFGEEVGEQGTPHLQGYVHFKSQKTMSAVKKAFKCSKMHLEAAKGDADANKKYCSKGTNIFEHGDMPQAGKRNDLVEIRASLKRVPSLRVVLDLNPSYQGFQMAKQILTLTQPPRRSNIEVYWYYGPTGCGKTHQAYDDTGDDEDTFVCNGTGQWWDGYDGQSKVIFDDYRRDFCKFHELLKICDKYRYRVPVKGAFMPFAGTRLWITTPKSIDETWEGRTEEEIGQLKRRVVTERGFFIKYVPPATDPVAHQPAGEDDSVQQAPRSPSASGGVGGDSGSNQSELIGSARSEVGGNTVPRPSWQLSDYSFAE